MGYYDYIDIRKSKPDNRTLILPHQQAAVEAMTEYFEPKKDVPDRNGIVVMPTGSGKTFTSVNWLLTQGIANGYRIVWLVHRQELVEQTYNEFVRQTPVLNDTQIKKLRILPVSGKRSHLHMSVANRADIYVCSIASVANKYGYRFIARMLGEQGKRRVIVVIDEAHHAVAGNYQKVLKRITALNPNRILLGLTATPKRMNAGDQGRLQKLFNIDKNLQLNKGKNGFVYNIALKDLIASGFLSQPVYTRVDTQLIGEVEYHCTPEDEAYFAKYYELSEKLKTNIARSSARNAVILKEYLNKKEKYGKTLIFAVNQLHAETLCDEFKKAGIRCEYIVSGKSDVQDTIQRFKNNEFDVLINVMIMTEGSDVPDIQTVFLTRETNSEALLMQMIGRGLRGEKASGTKIAYIVSFHDKWESFATWLDPIQLDIFDEAEEENEEETQELPEVKTNEGDLALTEDYLIRLAKGEQKEIDLDSRLAKEDEAADAREVYMKLYLRMRANLVSDEKVSATAIGWYSVIDDDGEDVKLLVFDTQKACYQSIENNLPLLVGKATPELLMNCYFNTCPTKPDENELQYLIDYIDETHCMPAFFKLVNAGMLSIKEIRNKVDSLFEKEEEKEAWLKNLYDNSLILQQIYRYFFAFKKTVLNYTEEVTEAEIEEIAPELLKYEYVENYYNLNELLDEVLALFPKLTKNNLVKIEWSNQFVTQWFALCTRALVDGRLMFQIHVNKRFSSPQVDKEVVKYLIFHELLHSNGYWDHNIDFRSREWQYPHSEDYDSFLDSLEAEYDLTDIYATAVGNEEYTFDTDTDSATEPAEASDTAENQTEPESFDSTASGVINGFKYCRNCGNKLPEDAKFCDKCGNPTDY